MTSRNLLGEMLEGHSDDEVAYRLGLRWWRQVRAWRAGTYFPQRRWWDQLARILGRSRLEIEAAHAAYRADGRK